MGADRWDEQVGSVADEAAKLLESLRRSAETATATAPGAAHADADADTDEPRGRREGEREARRDGEPLASEAGGHDPFCTWCPLCRTAEVVRSLSPETITRLADLATLAATVLADFASARAADAPSDAGESPTRRPAASAAPRPSPSRPIPVRDAEPVSVDAPAADPKEAPRG